LPYEAARRRAQRSLVRRVENAHLGRFRHLSDFDWQWPKLTLAALKSSQHQIAQHSM
jgi:hypothetical protein